MFLEASRGIRLICVSQRAIQSVSVGYQENAEEDAAAIDE
jgi:hypothetical protein